MKVQEIKNSGVYGIYDSSNNCLYVGCSTDLYSRQKNHENELRKGAHPNRDLQQISGQVGVDFLVFKIIMNCNASELFYYEKIFIQILNPLCNVVNKITIKTKANVNYFTEEYAKVEEHYKGQWVTAEMVAKVTGLNKKRVGMMFNVRSIKRERVGVNRTVRYRIPHH